MKYPIIIILLLTFLQQGQSQVPVASYIFDTNLQDQNGVALDRGGDMSSDLPTIMTDGGRSHLSFTGSGYAQKESPDYTLGAEWTIMFWMRTTDIDTDQKIIGQARGDLDQGYVIGVENEKLKVELFDDSNDVVLNSKNVPKDRWFHVTVRYDGSQLNILMNGYADVETTPVGYNPSIASQAFVLGGAPWQATALNYKGDIDDLRIYNTALSFEDIVVIAQCPNTGYPIYVDQAERTNRSLTGLTWGDSYTDLQDAIDLSKTCPTNPDIWVADGTYRPSKIYDIDKDDVLEERERTFYIEQPTKIYGGFNGYETSIDQRDDYFEIEAPTILSGALDNGTDTAFHVVTIINQSVNNSYVLNRLTIQDGRATDLNSSNNGRGGGLYITASDINLPQISNCAFINNTGVNGGAIYASGQGCSISLDNCLFYNNHASNIGGAINAGGQFTSIGLLNNTLVNNSAATSGALYMSGLTVNANLINSIFWDNDASTGGDDIYSSSGGMSVKIANSITSQGGIFIADNMDIDTTMSFMHDDPMFGSDLMLMVGSPAVDAGDSTSVTAIFDLNGRPRMLGARVDIGAFEYGVHCQETLRFHLPQVFDNFKGFLGTEKNMIFNATIRNSSDIDLSHREGLIFTKEFTIDSGSKLRVYKAGCS